MADRALEERAARHAALGDPVRLAIVDELVCSDRAPVELAERFGLASNLLAHHLEVLERVGLIVRGRSSGDGRRRYVHLVAGELDTRQRSRLARPGRALFVCTHNSARSQLAAGLWSQLTGLPAVSAGTHPAERVHPGAVTAARRVGLDLAGVVPRHLDDVEADADLVVTVCDQAHEELPGHDDWWHWSVLDPVPSGTKAAFAATVAELRRRIDAVIGAGVVVTDLVDQPETGTGELHVSLGRRLVAEALGTGFLVVAVIGSGIMASRLSPSDVGLQLLENAAATAGALIGLILMLGSVSGAQFNPAVTLVDWLSGSMARRDALLYGAAQVVGGCVGAVVANLMFSLPAVDMSSRTRSSGALWLSEVVATGGLLLVIHGCVRSGRASSVAFAVGAWIGGAYFFTSSTSFANPAVTIARTLSDSFAGIAPSSAPMFIVMQVLGALIAYGLIRILFPHPSEPRK